MSRIIFDPGCRFSRGYPGHMTPRLAAVLEDLTAYDTTRRSIVVHSMNFGDDSIISKPISPTGDGLIPPKQNARVDLSLGELALLRQLLENTRIMERHRCS